MPGHHEEEIADAGDAEEIRKPFIINEATFVDIIAAFRASHNWTTTAAASAQTRPMFMKTTAVESSGEEFAMAMSIAAEGARARREERARREKKRKTRAPHTKLEDTATHHHQQQEHRIPRISSIFEDVAAYIPHVIPA